MKRAGLGQLVQIAAHLAAFCSPAVSQEQAVVTKHLIYPGQVVEPQSLETVDASYCPNCDAGYFRKAEDIVGKIAVRTLAPGKLLFPTDIRSAPAIRRGQEITVIFRSESLHISMLGVSMSDAALGETVTIRNMKSGAIVHGVAGLNGTVTVAQ